MKGDRQRPTLTQLFMDLVEMRGRPTLDLQGAANRRPASFSKHIDRAMA